jgi:hypothetical protein
MALANRYPSRSQGIGEGDIRTVSNDGDHYLVEGSSQANVL